MKLAKYVTDFFDAGELKFAGGKFYALVEETAAHIAQGLAEEVDAPADVERARKLAEKAQQAADKAAESARIAQADLVSAQEAKRLADDAQAMADAQERAASAPAEPDAPSYPALDELVNVAATPPVSDAVAAPADAPAATTATTGAPSKAT